jgi:hypothetical protein
MTFRKGKLPKKWRNKRNCFSPRMEKNERKKRSSSPGEGRNPLEIGRMEGERREEEDVRMHLELFCTRRHTKSGDK